MMSKFLLSINTIINVILVLFWSKCYSEPFNLLKTPTYCINSEALNIFGRRFSCLRGGSANSELLLLRNESAAEYLRAHELLAHEYFVENRQINPFWRPNCADSDVEFEYIPLLPLSWRAEPLFLTNDKINNCSYAAIIEDIVLYVNHVMKFKKKGELYDDPKFPQRFVIASTYNLRTELGKGMPTQARKGVIWETVSKFFTGLRIGHYERWSQCPDLLRRTWKGTVELPYLPISPASKIKTTETSGKVIKKFNFLYIGRLLLFGPERVCSVRNGIASLSHRSDVLVVNTTVQEYNSPMKFDIYSLASKSVFCLIAKADSYSSSWFYIALHAGCIPIVISDWFVFAYPWIIDYKEFVIRISETDFLKNPNEVLDKIVNDFYLPKHNTISELTNSLFSTDLYHVNLKSKYQAMLNWRVLLQFDSISTDSKEYAMFRNALKTTAIEAIKLPNNTDFSTIAMHGSKLLNDKEITFHASAIMPFEVMLYEMRFSALDGRVRQDLPCYAPGTCSNDGKSMQVKPYAWKNGEIKESRSHLCQHSHRLIGMYKIVYFMQCVRILWPLKPGHLHKYEIPSRDTTPIFIRGRKMERLSFEDRDFIMSFHDINRTKGWDFITYPILNGTKNVKTLSIALNSEYS